MSVPMVPVKPKYFSKSPYVVKGAVLGKVHSKRDSRKASNDNHLNSLVKSKNRATARASSAL